jgi:hypothetical protein
MKNKLKRFSYNQLIVLQVFLRHAGQVMTMRALEKEVSLSGKSLGGVISSLSRTRFRNISLIEPVGASRDRAGLRWLLNSQIIDVKEALSESSRLIGLYK